MSSIPNDTPAAGRFTALLVPELLAGASPEEADVIFRFAGYMGRMSPTRLRQANRLLELMVRCSELGLCETPHFQNKISFLAGKVRASRHCAVKNQNTG